MELSLISIIIYYQLNYWIQDLYLNLKHIIKYGEFIEEANKSFLRFGKESGNRAYIYIQDYNVINLTEKKRKFDCIDNEIVVTDVDKIVKVLETNSLTDDEIENLMKAFQDDEDKKMCDDNSMLIDLDEMENNQKQDVEVCSSSSNVHQTKNDKELKSELWDIVAPEITKNILNKVCSSDIIKKLKIFIKNNIDSIKISNTIDLTITNVIDLTKNDDDDDDEDDDSISRDDA